jgi:hypothetical protein
MYSGDKTPRREKRQEEKYQTNKNYKKKDAKTAKAPTR